MLISEHRFMKRCFYFQRPYCPVAVIKYNDGEKEIVKALMNVKQTYEMRKKYEDSNYLIQRYIYPYNSQACKYRVEYSISDSIITYTKMKNPLNIFGNKVTELGHSVNINLNCKNEEKFFVSKLQFKKSHKGINESLKTQMKTLKKIIETEDAKNQMVSHITADFTKDSENK